MAAQLKKLFVKFADYKAHAGKAVAVLVQVLHKLIYMKKGVSCGAEIMSKKRSSARNNHKRN